MANIKAFMQYTFVNGSWAPKVKLRDAWAAGHAGKDVVRNASAASLRIFRKICSGAPGSSKYD